MKESFLFYSSYLQSVEAIKEAFPDKWPILLLNICQYGLQGSTTSDDDPIINAIMVQVKASIDAADKRRLTAQENGKHGGRPLKRPAEQPVSDDCQPNSSTVPTNWQQLNPPGDISRFFEDANEF